MDRITFSVDHRPFERKQALQPSAICRAGTAVDTGTSSTITSADRAYNRTIGDKSREIRRGLSFRYLVVPLPTVMDSSREIADVDFRRLSTLRDRAPPLNWSLPGPSRLLDVGGYPGRMRTMLPDHDWVICDPRVDSPGNQVRGGAERLPFKDQSFDFIVSLDVLEHIPPERRGPALEEMIRVSRQGLILSFPHKHPLVEAGTACPHGIFMERALAVRALSMICPIPRSSPALVAFGAGGGFDVGQLSLGVLQIGCAPRSATQHLDTPEN